MATNNNKNQRNNGKGGSPYRTGSGDDSKTNFVALAVTVVQDARYGYSGNGAPWASIRVVKGFGKDEGGNYRPSIFFNAKIFGEPGTDFTDTLADAMQVSKGDRLVIRGALGVPEAWEDKDGNGHTDLVIKLKSKDGIKPVQAGGSAHAGSELDEVP